MAGRGYAQGKVPAPPFISTSLDFDPDSVTNNWLCHLKKIWGSWKKSAGLTETLHKFYCSMENPYYSTLYLMANSGDFNLAKPNSLTFTVMEEFRDWLCYNKSEVHSYLTLSLKKKAFNIVTKQRNMALIKLVAEIYEMADSKNDFVEEIQPILDMKQYKEVCQIVSILGLQDHFDVEYFLIPLVFQDKNGVVDDYLDVTPNAQIELVSYLDNLIRAPNLLDLVDAIVSRLSIPLVKLNKLHYKPLSKFLSRIVKKYQIPPSYCPNLNQKKNEGALNFLMTKKYRDNSIGGDSWREMVMETVAESRDLQMELIHSLCAFTDRKEAMYWAETFSIPFSDLPSILKEMLELANQREMNGVVENDINESPEDWDAESDREEYFEFPLPVECIVIVDTLDKLQKLIEFDLDGVSIIGFDSEWKPAFGTKISELSLLQIATINHVFIVDVLVLDKESHWWQKLGTKLFSNQDILKLGFSFDGDINMIRHSVKNLSDVKMSGIGYLDLSHLWKTLTKDWSIEFPYNVSNSSTTTAESLSRLVQLCCGRPLNKSDQFSNWQKRPLRDTQKVYAALDAYCLLLAYEVMKECSQRQDVPFYDICAEVMSKQPMKKTYHKKKHQKQRAEVLEMAPKPNPEPVPTSWLHPMCMSGLEGLAKHLRMCGIDVLVPPVGMNYEQYLQIAISEKRIVLVKGAFYNRFSKDLPPAHCFRVDSEDIDHQLADVLEYYNVVVKKSDIFSRCMLCNGDEFTKMESREMKEIMEKASKQKQTLPSQYQQPVNEVYNYDDFEDDDYEDDFQPGPPINTTDTFKPQPVQTFITRSGAPIQMQDIPAAVVDRVPLFYVCDNCGKCYWDGTHLERVLQGRLQKVITRLTSDPRIRFQK